MPDAPAFRRPTINTPVPLDAWSDFWSTSRQGAIDLGADDPVAEALRRHWLEQVPWLMACNTVVDVGSGPAVLPRLLLGLRPAQLGLLPWVCIDRAHIASGTDVPATVRLLDGVDFGASAPPVGDALADGIVSNFGIEYVEPATLAVGFARWLAPGGRLHAIVHASGSIIDQVSASAADDIVWALDEVKLFDAARELLATMSALPTDPIDRMMHGVNERDAYNAAVNRLKQRMETRGEVSAPLMDMLNGLRALTGLALDGSSEQALAALAARRVALRGEIQRLHAMKRCALDAERLQALSQALATAGIAADPVTCVDCALGSVAWVVSGRRT